jgi:hypothetical protein
VVEQLEMRTIRHNILVIMNDYGLGVVARDGDDCVR